MSDKKDLNYNNLSKLKASELDNILSDKRSELYQITKEKHIKISQILSIQSQIHSEREKDSK